MSPAAAKRDAPLTLSYELAELPSSQHRAGLAGLVLMCRWLVEQAKHERRGVCEIKTLDAHRLVLRIDRAGLGALFDQVYGARKIERAYPRPFKGKDPKRAETRTETNDKTGKTKEVTSYIYDLVEPKGAYLADWDPEGGPWTKLWRDMLWNILRGVPATRGPFEKRADNAPASDADDLFAQLSRTDATVDLPSTYFLGAQAQTAENVRFRDFARYQLLLHFWSFVAPIYVPAVIDNEGKRKFEGYAIAVPDVADLEEFCAELPDAMRERSPEITGYIPAQAAVDIALESALDLLARLLQRLRLRGRHQLDLVQGVDVFHVNKEGNNVRILATGRVDIDEIAIDHYIRLRDAYSDNRFRSQRLRNLVEQRPWYAGFDHIFATKPWKQTIGSRWFCRDARNAFTEYETTPTVETSSMSEQETNADSLESLIYRVVNVYLGAKLNNKYGLKWQDVKESKDAEKKKDYDKYREKLAKDAFLAIRSRTGSDFIDYFSGTLFSEPQRGLSESAFTTLARALLEQPDKVRTLTLLALSARA